MSTVGVYDYDFMNYEHVIPNLECAKLYTYYHNHHEIATLAPQLEPARYTSFFVRKEYNDGYFPKQIFAQNCSYGGRAFNPMHYIPLDPGIEKTIPNMHLYDNYMDRFGTKPSDKTLIRYILNCAHVRLSTDGKNPKSMNQLVRILDTGNYSGIIFHDYNLGAVDNSYDIVYELSQTRTYKTKKGIRPYLIGNKFPIQLNSSTEMEKWFKVGAMQNLFCLQYNGIMPNDVVFDLSKLNRQFSSQVYYNIGVTWYDENHFLEHVLPKIFKQILFLRRNGTRISLIFDDDPNIPIEIKNFIKLLNCWLGFSWQEGFLSNTQTLYNFCRKDKVLHDKSWAFRNVNTTNEEKRDSFQYIREKNYELFKMFYEWDSVSFKGGEFINDWKRD